MRKGIPYPLPVTVSERPSSSKFKWTYLELATEGSLQYVSTKQRYLESPWRFKHGVDPTLRLEVSFVESTFFGVVLKSQKEHRPFFRVSNTGSNKYPIRLERRKFGFGGQTKQWILLTCVSTSMVWSLSHRCGWLCCNWVLYPLFAYATL